MHIKEMYDEIRWLQMKAWKPRREKKKKKNFIE